MKRWTTSFLLVALACTFGLLGGGIVMYIRSALASRNSAGTYSLASSPVTTLQTISTSLWNNTFADLATGVTDSLDRNGRGGMLAALRGIDGTVAAPAFAYTSETGSGEYRIGAGDLGWAILGGKKLELTSSLFTVTPALTVTGAATLSSTLALSDVFTQTISGSASIAPFTIFQPSLSNGNFIQQRLGVAASANQAVTFTFNPNATPANSTGCLALYGQTSTLCVDGNNKTYIGSGGTGIATISAGSCTLNGGTPATCTATVVSGAKCVASKVQTGGGTAQSVSVSSTTLTVTSAAAGDTAVANYFCWI